MKAERTWEAALGQLQMEMPRASFDTWVRDAELLTYEDGLFVVGVQNAFARDWLEDRLASTVRRVLSGITGKTVEVRFVVWTGEPTELEETHRADLDLPVNGPVPVDIECHLNPRYSFDSFIVGTSNRLAHAAAVAVSENPAQAYNPLFLYGGVGLGKTHLLHALGHACRASGLRVLYVSSEEFTNDLINAIRTRSTDAFRQRYRQIEVLLIDDIQFLAGKESTQEEFFHTFNTLHGLDKQLVISSDRPPKALMTLEERLRSRFEWGLTADIQPPDFETRVAILRSKAEKLNQAIALEHLEKIARRVQSNIRELEGALNRVVAYADMADQLVDGALVESALTELMPRETTLTPERIMATVADNFGLSLEALVSRNRSRKIALPRQIAMYLIREETPTSLPKIGEKLGGRDHTTILYGCDKVADLMETDDTLRRQVMGIRESLYLALHPAEGAFS